MGIMGIRLDQMPATTSREEMDRFNDLSLSPPLTEAIRQVGDVLAGVPGATWPSTKPRHFESIGLCGDAQTKYCWESRMDSFIKKGR